MHGTGSGITGWAAAARERQQNHGEGSDRPIGQPQHAGARTARTLFFSFGHVACHLINGGKSIDLKSARWQERKSHYKGPI
jgi:hypothetical protein